MQPSPKSPRRPPGGRRWLRGILIGFGSLIALLVLVVTGAFVYVSTPSGGERIRRLVVEKTNAAIEGQLTIRELQLKGGHLLLRGVELKDPEGGAVATVRELEVRLRLSALLHKTIDVSLARIDTPVLTLKQDERGMNLSRAIASRNPQPAKQKSSSKSSVGFELNQLELQRATIDFIQNVPGTQRHVHVDDLNGSGNARMVGEALGAALKLDAQVTEPIKGPFALRLNANGKGDAKSGDLSLELGDARIVAHVQQPDPNHAHVKLDTVEVPPELVQAFSSSYPLQVPAAISGLIDKAGDVVSTQLALDAGSARGRIEGSFNLKTHVSDGLHVRLRDVDLSELLANGPASRIALQLDAAGGGTSADDADATVKLLVPPSKMEGEQMGPIRLEASAHHGHFVLSELIADVPGLALNAHGEGTREHVALSGELVASDLQRLSRTLGKFANQGKGIALSGSGHLSFAVKGAVKNPSLDANGDFPSLRVQTNQVSQLSIRAHVKTMKRPTGAQVSIDAKRLTLSQKKFRDVHLGLNGDGRNNVRLDAAVHGYAELALSALASLDASGQGGELKQLSLAYPEAQWRLTEPSRVSVIGKKLEVTPLTLRADRQSISLRLTRRASKLDAAVAIDRFDLGRLPKAFVDPNLKLGGILDLHATAKGEMAKPDVVARVNLQNGRFKKYSRLALKLNAQYVKERARGSLAANGEGVDLTARFDVPINELKTGGPDRVFAEARIAQLRLDDSLRQLGIQKPIRGLAAARLSLTGTASNPKLDLVAKVDSLQVRELPRSNVRILARSGERNRLLARVDFEMLSRKSFVEVKTPFTLGQLLQKPPTKDQMLKAPIALNADVREFPLPILYTAGFTDREIVGALSARAQLQGPAMGPKGTLSLTAMGVTTGGLKPIDANLKLLSGNDVRLTVRAERGQSVLIDGKAQVGLALADVRDTQKLTTAPVSLDATLGPILLSDLQAATQPVDTDPAKASTPLNGTLKGTLKAHGTLHNPTVTLRSHVEGLGAKGQNAIGNVDVSFDYAHAQDALALVLRSANGGDLTMKANAPVDLSYPAVTAKRDLKSTPIQASLVATHFDPSFLSHVSDMVERVGGEIRANATLWGTLGAPKGSGDLEWSNGVLDTNGFGDFKELHLLASASNDKIELKDFSLKSGQGKAKLSALAQRAGANFQVHADASLEKFPVMTDGQLAATISLRSTADGHASASRLMISALNIPEAHVQIPDVKKKNLQKLDAAQDIVLTRNGKPIKGRKTGTVESAQPQTGVGGSGNAGTGASASPGFSALVKVNAPRNLWVTGNDIDTEFGLSDGFRIEYAAGSPTLFGDVNILRGRLEVFGRRFDFQKDNAKVTFTGPILQPDLNVTAIYKNETEHVTVYLKATGQGTKVALQPSSEPPLTETEIYTLLATGHTSLRHGSGTTSPAGEAASVLGSLAASQLKKTLSNKLPLDVLSIEAGDNGLTGTKVEAGTYVNDRLYLGFTGRVGADPMRGENANQVNLEYQLSKHWSLEGNYGDARAGGADIIWQKDY